MSFETVFNPGDGPAFASSDGKVVDAHGWGCVDTADPIVVQAVAAGRLLIVETPDVVVTGPESGVAPGAAAAARLVHDEREKAARRAHPSHPAPPAKPATPAKPETAAPAGPAAPATPAPAPAKPPKKSNTTAQTSTPAAETKTTEAN